MGTNNILAIAGTGRTGSTILSLLLTQHPKVFNLGQLRDLWQSYDQDLPCSCGRKLSRCPVYSQALPQLLGEGDSKGLAGMKHLMRAFFKAAASRPDWTNPNTLARLRQDHGDFLARLDKVIQALRNTTGIHNFVDTSKSPEMALAFSLADGISLRVVNLVRDPRAVVCSWHEKKKGKIIRSSRDWARRQRIMEAWGGQMGERFLQVRYEQFASHPRETVNNILTWTAYPQSEKLFTNSNQAVVSWEGQHLFPPANERVLKERKTDVLIVPAEAWRAPRNLPVHLMAMLLTYPAGLKYIRSHPAND